MRACLEAEVRGVDCNQCNLTLARQVLEDHARPVLSLAVAGDKLFSGSYDYTIKVSTWRERTAVAAVRSLQQCCVLQTPSERRPRRKISSSERFPRF